MSTPRKPTAGFWIVVGPILILLACGVALLGVADDYASPFIADALKDIAATEPPDSHPQRFTDLLDAAKRRKLIAHLVIATAIGAIGALAIRKSRTQTTSI